MFNYQPALHYQALHIKALLEVARHLGYTEEEIKSFYDQAFGSEEPVLITLDEIYGKEEEDW